MTDPVSNRRALQPEDCECGHPAGLHSHAGVGDVTECAACRCPRHRRAVQGEEEPWGHKITFSVYMPGSERAAESAWERGARVLDEELPAADFIGARVDVVQDAPKEQGGS